MKPVLYINMKQEDIPTDKNDPRYKPFWEEEKRKVLEGVTIDGFHFTGWLYWHINHWCITLDKQMPNGEIIPEPGKPILRDNEVIINNGLKRCFEEKSHLLILGLRQMAKTTTEASYTGRSSVVFKGSQNLILGTNVGDLNNLTANIDFGLLNCTPYFRVPRITRDWDSERVQLGLKTKSGDNIIHSQFVIRNTAGGKKTEAGAGTTIKAGVYDEIGKDKWLESYTAIGPAMISRFGIRAVFIAVGTGGSFEKGEDAKKAFFDPEIYNFLPYTQPDGRITGLFMSGLYRQDCKYETTLDKYLIEEGILTEVSEDSELKLTKILVSDKELAYERCQEERKRALGSNDTKNYLKVVAYNPLVVDEVFLTEANNPFPVEAIQAQQEILRNRYEPYCVEFYRDKDNKVCIKPSDKKPIDKFPIRSDDIKDAPTVIYEPFISGLPYGTYVVGIDPYNEDTSSDKINSLGSIVVLKRMHNPLGENQNCIVATYSGRCRQVKDFHQLCLDICEYYQAIALPENADKTLIQFFFFKKNGHLLADSFELSRQINPLTKSDRQKGLSPSAPNQKYYMNLMVEYCKEDIYTVSESGEEITRAGVVRIPDVMLLEELKNYRGKPSSSKGVHDGNFDRIIAFGHALTLAKYYDIKFPATEASNNKVVTVDKNGKKNHYVASPFTGFSKAAANMGINRGPFLGNWK